MITESKIMFLGCALALIVGASLVSPLLILNTVIDPFPDNPPLYPNPQSSQSEIAANIKSARIEIGTITNPNSTQPPFDESISVNAAKHLNDKQNMPDAEVDYFQVQILTQDGTVVQDTKVYVGTAYTRAFTAQQAQTINCQQLYEAFGSFGSGMGAFYYTWSIGTTHVPTQSINGNIDQRTAALMLNSQTLTIALSRIGTITIKGNSTVASASDVGLIENVTLTRNGNIFEYNP